MVMYTRKRDDSISQKHYIIHYMYEAPIHLTYLSLNCSAEFADLIFRRIVFRILALEQAKEFLKLSQLGFGTYSKSSEVDLKLRLCISFVC